MYISFDVMQALLWSVAYILIIIFNIKYKYTAMPLFALINNFAWESVALARDILSGRVFDSYCMVYFRPCHRHYIFAVVQETVFKKSFFVLIYLVVLLVLVFSFNMWSSGMLISSFVIDFTMAVEYFIYSSKEVFPANRLSISICSLKLCGDLCAWICYMENSRFVLVIGFFVQILNILCLKTMIKRNHK